MRVVSWNYQGLGSTLTVQVLKGHIEKYDPDIVFLMETKNSKESRKCEKKNEVCKWDDSGSKWVE